MPASVASSYPWKFFRLGGLDQVAIETGADLLALEGLDQKLWVALSCPVQGLELDEKTLALIDLDGDGRIRPVELIAAIRWSAARLKDVGALLSGRDTLPFTIFDDSRVEGRATLAAAREILASLGQPAALEISLAEATDTAKILAGTKFNGDSIVTMESSGDPALRDLIADILATVGGVPDRSGPLGVDQPRVDLFFAACAAFADWSGQGEGEDVMAFGPDTPGAWDAVRAIRAKAVDFFARCRLAAFDPRALGALNRAESDYIALAARDLSAQDAALAAFPLARIEAGRRLPLLAGVNPAWAEAAAALHRAVVVPLFGPETLSLGEEQWAAIEARLAPYEAWLAAKAGAAVEPLGLARVRAIVAADQRAALAALIDRDRSMAADFDALADVEKLLRFSRDFRVLLDNFVNFSDFYSPDRLAVFQAGTLYLDSRSTEFCVRLEGPSPLAAMSKACIAYLECRRLDGATMKVAACFTQGDSDYLFAGRHGVFYDRRGRDWDATITSLADNPIGIHQAFLSPYKKFVRLIEEQVAKRAAAAEAETTDQLAATAGQVVLAAPGPAPKKIDVGTIAALGVAVGAIGGALGAVATGLARLSPLQLPLVPIGLMVAISGPSMLIAWLKLRQRNLGPLLEAAGWAINGRVRINLPLGERLTELATLPPHARRIAADPYADSRARWVKFAALLALVAGVFLGWYLVLAWYFHPELHWWPWGH